MREGGWREAVSERMPESKAKCWERAKMARREMGIEDERRVERCQRETGGQRMEGGLRKRRGRQQGRRKSLAKERNRVVRSEGMRVLGRDGGEEG